VLTASTSEAYTWLFKLLCDPGTSVLVPRPSYPLFEHLTRLEGVCATPFELEYHGRWDIDFTTLASAPVTTRAVIIVSPNNPTGSFVSARDIQRLSALCRDRGWALIVDEVFADYPLEADAPLTDIAARSDVLAFTLGGLSKSAGLPQLKLGWIVVGGPPAARDAALAGLEVVADSFLSVATPVQLAAAGLLERAAAIRAQIHERTRANLAMLRDAARSFAACEVLRTEGGWSAVMRVPATRSEEQLVLDLLEHEGILVHPGYFFDFQHEAFVVASLLPPPDVFRDASKRLLRFAHS
jgi:aspartate/methionine/tyrosine aminotransferase